MRAIACILCFLCLEGCIVAVEPLEEAPPEAKSEPVPTHTMFDTLNSPIVWSHDEQYLYACGRSGLVQVEIATGATRVIDSRVTWYEGLTVSGSGNYLYCLLSEYRYDGSSSHQSRVVLRYRLGDFACDTVVSGEDIGFLASPSTDEIACTYYREDSTVMIDPETGTRRGLGGVKPIAYAMDGSGLLVGDMYDASTYSVLRPDGTIRSMGLVNQVPYYGASLRIVWGGEDVMIVYTISEQYTSNQTNVYNLTTGSTLNLGSSAWAIEFSPDASQIVYWSENVTEWLNLFLYRVPSEADFIINITHLSTHSTRSYTYAHSDAPRTVYVGSIGIAPTGKRIAFVYDGLIEIMAIDERASFTPSRVR